MRARRQITIAEQVREACASMVEDRAPDVALKIRSLDLTQFEPKVPEDVRAKIHNAMSFLVVNGDDQLPPKAMNAITDVFDLIESLSARVAELEQDARRYQFFRDPINGFCGIQSSNLHGRSGLSYRYLDEAIDAAIGKPEPAGE